MLVAIMKSTMTRLRRHEKSDISWEGALELLKIPYEYINCYDYDVVSKLKDYTHLIWHYENYMNADLMEAQNILDTAEKMGLKVFPNHNTGWHFDDKIAEVYALQAVKAPIPENWMFYEPDVCFNWLKSEARYPLIGKLRRGSGSNNVKLLKNKKEAVAYAKKMFSGGFSPAQSLLYKTYSKAQSTKDIKTLMNRIKKIPDFLISRKYGKGIPRERGYCYFQEFIKNDGYDIKIAVAGNKCSYLVRNVRKGSFKASGGGDIFYDNKLVKKNIIRSAFEAADKLGMQCVGFDYVVDQRSGKGYIIEMCYGFDFKAIFDCGGYWDRNLVWHQESLNIPLEVVKKLVE